MSPSFFESIRILDGHPQLLEFHQKRVHRTFLQNGNLESSPNLAEILAKQKLPGSGLYKCRLDYAIDGSTLPPEIVPYTPKRITHLYCVEAPSLDYSFKWADRSALEAPGKNLPAETEILLLQKGNITDTRYSNVVFGEPGDWVTPTTFLLQGVKRTALLEQGVIRERPISMHDLNNFPYCSLINAMLDPGEIMIPLNQILR